MKILHILIILFLPGITWSFQCPPDETEKDLYKNSNSVLFVRVLRTELVEHNENGHDVNLLKAEYELVESFKGSKNKNGELVDILGYGTGFVGLTPGVYYIVYLSEETKIKGIHWVNMCNVKLGTFNPKGTQVIEKLTSLREMGGE